jgi:hypothetical protein
LTSIGGNAFNGCASLKELTFTSSTAPAITNLDTTFSGVPSSVTLYYPEGSEDSYNGRFSSRGWTLELLRHASLALGEGAEDTLKALVVYEGPTEVELVYTGRENVASEEITIARFKNTSTDPESPTYEQTDTIEAGYNLTEKTLTVEPAAFGSYKLTITVAAKEGYEEATLDIFVEVAKKATELIPTISLDEPLELKAGDPIEDMRVIAFSYTGKKLVFSNPQSSNSNVAEIISFVANEDGTGGEIVVKGKMASTEPITLSIDAVSTTDGETVDTNYAPYTLTFQVIVSRSDAALSVVPDTLELKVGESDTASVLNVSGRAVTAVSDNDAVTVAYEAGTLTVRADREGEATITISAAQSDSVNASQCALLVTVTKAADVGEEGVYAFVCQEPGVDGYTFVVKNRSGEPSGYGTVVHSYAENLATITTASRTSGWPWSGAIDEYKASVSKIVFAEDAGNYVPLSYMRFMFTGFSSCKVLDFTWLETVDYNEQTELTAPRFAGYASGVYNTNNTDVTVIFGSKVKVTEVGIRNNAAALTIYREYNGTYGIYSPSYVPEGEATFYTVKPDACTLSNDLADYEVKLGATEYVFTGSVLPPAADVSVVLKNDDSIVVPSVNFKKSTIYSLTYQRYFAGTDSWSTVSGFSLGHYRVLANTGSQTPATGYLAYKTTAYVEYDVIPGGEISLYSDAALQIPLSGDGLQLTGTTELYAKCTTGLSGVDGTNEMKVAAESSDTAVLGATATKLGEYGDGYWTYKITLVPYTTGEASVSVWGYTGGIGQNGNDNRQTGTLTTVLSANVDIQPATLELGAGAQEALNSIEMLNEPTVVDLIYTGRDDATSDEVTIEYFRSASSTHPIWNPTEAIEASYDPAEGKLTVVPPATLIGSYKLTITVPGAGTYGAATIDVYAYVSQKTVELIPTQPLEQPLQLTPGELRVLQFTYTGENLLLFTPESSNSAVAEIVDYSVGTDGKSGEIIVRAKAASTSSVRLSFSVNGSVGYKPFAYYLTVKVSKADELLSVDPDTLTLAIGESGAATVSNDRNRTVTATSSDEEVAKVTYVAATKQLSIEAIGEGEATITLTAAETAALNESECSIEVTVTENAVASISTDPDALIIKVGESDTAEVTYTGDGAIEVTSSAASIATATLANNTLSINALTEGTATITLRAEATQNYGAAECTVEVTVTETAVASLSTDPDELIFKVGERVTADVSYTGDGAIEVTSSAANIATATLAGNTLSINALTEGTATITLRAAATQNYGAAECTVAVTVSAAAGGKDDAPPLDIDTDYEVVVGGEPWSVTYSEVLQYEVNPAGIISVTSSNAGKTLTVTAVGTGSAVLTIWAEETATTAALEPVEIEFTVADTTPEPKPVVELDPLSLPVGATATSAITLYDADDNPLSGIITFSGYDVEVIEVSFDEATSEFTIHALGIGETTLTISSEEAAEDYTMQITVTEADDDPDDPGVTPTVQANGTGVKVSGTLKGTNIPEGAEAVVTITAVTSGDAYDKHIAAKGDGDILVVYEIALTVNGEEVHDNFGTLTIELPVGDGYEADTILVRHLHESGDFTEHNLNVVEGIARLEVSDLSSFGLEAQEVTKPASGTGTKPASSGTTTPAKTGDEAPYVIGGLLALGAVAATVMRVSRRRKDDDAHDDPQALT